MFGQFRPRRPFKAPHWDADAHTPVMDCKFEDHLTGEIRTTLGSSHGGPSEVDIVIFSVHEETAGCVYLSSRPFKMEHLLIHIAHVVDTHELRIDSLNATPYAIRVVLAHELTKDEFSTIANEISNGLWPADEEEEHRQCIESYRDLASD